MNETSVTFSIGSAAYAAKRAAEIVGLLQNRAQLDDAQLLERLSDTLQRYGEAEPVMPEDLTPMLRVASELYKVFEAPDTAQAAAQINTILAARAHSPRLSSHSDTPWHIHVDSDDNTAWAEWFAASSAMALATLLAEKQRKPGGICASSRCQQPFVDLGKGGGRNYCSPRCATRERVATYRKRISHS